MAYISQYNFMDSASSVMENMIEFHDFAMLVIINIMTMIMYMFLMMIVNKGTDRYLLENQYIEFIWTLFPMVFLVFLAIPSLKILYMTDEVMKPLLTVKSIGHQWYWSYEYNDFNDVEFSSFMVNDLNDKLNFRLLDVDNRLILPMNSEIRMLVNSSDVIHSFTVPSLGVKVDAVPGRINQININMNRFGLFFGQCSEICGVNHSFMPIVVESTNLQNFLKWMKNFK